jgi:hypothetical protein
MTKEELKILKAILEAWEKPHKDRKEGVHMTVNEIEKWLWNDMKPPIAELRKLLNNGMIK